MLTYSGTEVIRLAKIASFNGPWQPFMWDFQGLGETSAAQSRLSRKEATRGVNLSGSTRKESCP